jgi:hypothetical protein
MYNTARVGYVGQLTDEMTKQGCYLNNNGKEDFSALNF